MIIQMLNPIHIAVLLTIPSFIVLSWLLLKSKSRRMQDAFVWIVMGLIIAAYVITFAVDCITKAEHRAAILKNLPLHLCGINVFFFPLCFSLRKSKSIVKHVALGYLYFTGSPSALLGSLMPPGGVAGESLFTYNVITYFIKHNLIFALPILLVLLKYYKPKARDMLYSAAALSVLLCLIHGVNLMFSAIGGYRVNYFYTRFPDNFVLEYFWKLIPVELVYMFALIILLVPIFAIYYFASRIPDAMRVRQAAGSKKI